MINNSPFDDNIKKKIGHYEPEVPAHIWENIIAKKEKRKPAGFLTWFFNNRFKIILTALIIFGGTLLFNNINDHNLNKVHAINENKKTVISSTNEAGIVAGTKTASNTEVKKLTGENVLTTAGEKTRPVSPPDNNTDNNLNVGINSKPVKANSSLSENLTANKSGWKKDNDKHAGGNLGYENSSSLSFNKTGNRKEKKSGAKSSLFTETPETASYNSSGEIDPGTKNEITQSEDLLLERNFLNLHASFNELTYNPEIKKIRTPVLNIPCPEIEKNTSGNKRYFEIYGGPDYAFRSFSDTANSAYLQKRKESTRFSSAFSLGIRYTKVFNNAMSFRTGINYSQVNEKFKFVQGNIVQLVYIIDNNGDTTGSYATTATRYKTTYNKYRTIDVPLIVGYEWGNGRLHANFNAGVMVNVYSWQQGDLLDTAFQPINITTGKATSAYQFKTNVGIGFMGAVSVYYKLSDRLHFLAEPYFRYNFSPVSKAELSLKQKYSSAGIRLGLRFDF